MNAFAILATVMNRCSVLLFSILPSGQATRTTVNLLLKVEYEGRDRRQEVRES